MKKLLNEERLCELAGLQQEVDTEEMPPIGDPAATRELTPVEFKKELARQTEIEKYSEKDMLNMWRAWSAEKKKAEEANKPPPPVTAALPAADPQKSLSATQDIDYDPDPTGAEYKKKWKGKKYTESERLFRHFFGKYLDDSNRPTDALKMQMDHDDHLREIIIQLYGWQLPALFRATPQGHVEDYEGPGTDIMKIAQEFESKGKPIEGNEDEFMEMLQSYQYKTGKAQMEPLKQEQAKAAATKNALNDVIELARKEPGQESLPPLEHMTYPEGQKKYAAQLMAVYKNQYEDLYKKYLDAYLA